MATGVVYAYNIRKGIGFIEDDNSRLHVFLQHAHITDDNKDFKAGDKVQSDIKETDSGPAARVVKRIVETPAS